jgi:hypothetical protein
MVPNLLCVVGAFMFGLSGLAAVIISNFGTSMVYNDAMRSLRAAVVRRPDIAWDSDGDGEAAGLIPPCGEVAEEGRSA